VLTECDATAETRSGDHDHNTVVKLLWTAAGIDTVLAIWKRFTKWRHERGGRDEDGEEERREMGYGWGGLRGSV
jgi:hypothetical protein